MFLKRKHLLGPATHFNTNIYDISFFCIQFSIINLLAMNISVYSSYSKYMSLLPCKCSTKDLTVISIHFSASEHMIKFLALLKVKKYVFIKYFQLPGKFRPCSLTLKVNLKEFVFINEPFTC